MSFYPTPQQATIVETWTRAGIGKERIAKRLGISLNQLETSFPYELGYTDETALAIVADVAYQMAISGNHPTMTKWWMEVRGGWVAGAASASGAEKKPLQILLDPSEVIEGVYEEMEESNVVDIEPSS